MGLFGNKASLADLRDNEEEAAQISRRNATEAAETGRPVHGINADGWNQRAETFQAEADRYQQQIDRKRH